LLSVLDHYLTAILGILLELDGVLSVNLVPTVQKIDLFFILPSPFGYS
jgi:hypothetical protein